MGLAGAGACVGPRVAMRTHASGRERAGEPLQPHHVAIVKALCRWLLGGRPGGRVDSGVGARTDLSWRGLRGANEVAKMRISPCEKHGLVTRWARAFGPVCVGGRR